jgi:hypothetical protein
LYTSSNIISAIKLAGRVKGVVLLGMDKKVLERKREKERTFEGNGHRWKDENKMDLNEVDVV